ncbi:MAG: helix-turn-helix domain-containing protein [Bacteroidales bacterium]|jgi:transcriptional regulator with XRE-family HTH domain|nr:helix-turn-helix domain-containing protein [Bacteroidales bacterium]
MPNFFNQVYVKTDGDILSEIGEYLRQRRINDNLTQQELADKVGISKDQLSKIERTGKTSLATLISISRKFNLLDQLLDVYKMPELTPIQKYEIEQKIKKIKTNRKRIRK